MSELFAKFEVNRESRWQSIVGLLLGSSALHLALAATVMYVPSLRDSLNILVLAGKTGYVDKPYQRTVFGESVQMVEVGPKFQYPPGYFAVGTLEAAVAPTPDLMAPKIVSQAGAVKPESSPTPNPSPAASPSPAVAQAQGAASPSPGKGGPAVGDQKANTPGDADKQQRDDAQKKLDDLAAANHTELPSEAEINRKPLKDLVKEASDLKDQNKLDIGQSFEVRIEADLDKDCHLSNPIPTRQSGDATLVALSTRAVGVLNESGLLSYLNLISEGKPIKIAFSINQDQHNLSAVLESELPNEDLARRKAAALNLALILGKATRKGKDEELLMNSTKADYDGNKVLIKFQMTREAVGDLLKKQLAASGPAKQS